MNVSEIMHHALADGVSVSLNGAGQVKITGDENMVNKWLPAIRDNKADILAAISPRLPGRTWTAGNPYTCKCGDVTGWTMAGQVLCPLCYHEKLYGPDDQAERPGETPAQILCKASSLTGVIAATDGKFCKDRQDHFCFGCKIYKPSNGSYYAN